MKPLLNRVAIVTGAGTGIGYGIAKVLAERGAKIVVADLDSKLGNQAVAKLQGFQADALFVPTDVSEISSVERMVDAVIATYGAIDILVNNVGVTYRQPFIDLTPETWNTVINVNLTSMLYCVRACYPHLKTSEHAAIVNITSVNAFRTIKGMGAYPATKAGIIGLTHSLALDLAPYVRVNAVAPGVILTDTWAIQMEDVDSALADRLRYIPRKRVGKPEDIGRAAAFLVSDDADFITGTVLRVDGGMLSQLYAGE